MKLKLEFGSGRIDRFIEKKLGANKQRRQIIKQHVKAARQEIKSLKQASVTVEIKESSNEEPMFRVDDDRSDSGSTVPSVCC